MKYLLTLNEKNEKIDIITPMEVLKKMKSTNIELLDYVHTKIEYAEFCSKQTKRGQSRKNERGRKRRSMFEKFDMAVIDPLYMDIWRKIYDEKNAKIEKFKVKIIYDGRKKSNLSQIIKGVKMAIFVGGISKQYYRIGLRNFYLA